MDDETAADTEVLIAGAGPVRLALALRAATFRNSLPVGALAALRMLDHRNRLQMQATCI